ncbi:hypothetical protein HKCCE2091_15250 [Rhodobacterales bacterium HKCCE2091]|nr:hypothetical protein [Rhodobacterales bacterium HKCCE2091]
MRDPGQVLSTSLQDDRERPAPAAGRAVGARGQSRDAAVELLRYLGAVGIVWFHLGGPMAWIGHAALEMFILLSVYYTLERTAADPDGPAAWRRLRVLRLWVFWSAVYGLLKFAQAHLENRPLGSEFEWWMILTGWSLPLWFLPFIYVMNGLGWTYLRHVPAPPAWLEGIGLAACSLLCLHLLGLGIGVPADQWALGAAAVFAAVAVFRAASGGGYVALAIWLAAIAAAVAAGRAPGGELLLVSVPVAAFVLLVPHRFDSALAVRLGMLSLAVYILHSGVAAALGVLLPGFDGVPAIAAVVALSTLLGLVLRRIPVIRHFI